MKKRILSVVLVMALCMSSLVACGKAPSGSSTPASASASASASAGADTASNFNKTGYPIVNQPITLKFMAKAGGDLLNLDYGNMGLFKKVEGLTNVKIDWNVMKEGDEYDQKKNLMYASGEYPDAMYGGTTVAEEEMYGVEQKILIPLNDYINEEYMPNLTRIFKAHPEYKKMISASDGNIYSLPTIDMTPGLTVAGHLFVNKKFLKNLGMEAPKTLAELEAVLEAIKTKDADGDGDPNNEIPYTSVFANNNTGLFYLYGLFGFTYPLEVNNGTVEFTAGSDKYRTALEWISKAYNKGWIDKEAISQDGATHQSKIKTGDVGLFNVWRLTRMNYSYEGITDDYELLLPPQVEGVKTRLTRMEALPQLGKFSVTSANKHVAETMRWADYFYDTLNALETTSGELGTIQVKNDEGRYYQKPKADGTAISNTELQAWSPVAQALRGSIPEEKADIIVPVPFQVEKQGYCAQTEPYIEKENLALMDLGRLPVEETSEKVLLQTEITKYLNENAVNFIMNGITDTTWKAYLAQFEKLGVNRYVELCQKSLDSMK